MPRRRFRDVITGLFTTAADAKARPENTVGERVDYLGRDAARAVATRADPSIAHPGEIVTVPRGTTVSRVMTDAEVDQHDLDVASKVAGTDAAAADRLLDTIGAPEAYTEEMAALTAESESTRFRDGGDVGPVEYLTTQVEEVVGLSVEIVVRDGDGRHVNWISTLDEPTRVSRGQMPALAVMLKQAIKGGSVMVGATYEEVRDAKQADALRYYDRARQAYIEHLDQFTLDGPIGGAVPAQREAFTDDGVEVLVDVNLFGLHGPTPPPLKVVYRKRGARDFVSRAEARANPAAHVALVVLARN